MDRRGAPLPKKRQQRNAGRANNTHANGNAIVVVESHNKFIKQKQDEISFGPSQQSNSLIQF